MKIKTKERWHRKPQAQPLLVVRWLLVNQCHQQVLGHPELQKLQVFLVDPESKINPKVKQLFDQV